MSKILEEDISSDLNNSENNESEDQDTYPMKNSKSQDIRIKHLNNLMLTDTDTPIKTKLKRPRLKSMSISNTNFFLEEKEEILKNLSKKQRKTSDYSEKDSLSFNSRECVIEWCHNVLANIKLTENEKKSIFYRFCTAYDFIMEKLFLIHQTIKEEKELKIFIITIFLLTYKLEGFSICKITITNLINAFLSEFNIDKKILGEKIIFYEMKILELIDFNPQIFDDNNIYQLSYLLYDLFNKKYFTEFSDGKKEKIEKMMNYINKSLSFSEEMIFDIFPIDKAMISFFIATKYYSKNEKNILELLEKYYDYLKNSLKVIKIPNLTPPVKTALKLTAEEQSIYQVLSFDYALSMDEILNSLPDGEIANLSYLLLQMELKGIVIENELHAFRRAERE